jgi:hypothetical protein
MATQIEVLDKLAKEKGFANWKELSEGKDKQGEQQTGFLGLPSMARETERLFKKETVERAVLLALEGKQ